MLHSEVRRVSNNSETQIIQLEEETLEILINRVGSSPEA